MKLSKCRHGNCICGHGIKLPGFATMTRWGGCSHSLQKVLEMSVQIPAYHMIVQIIKEKKMQSTTLKVNSVTADMLLPF